MKAKVWDTLIGNRTADLLSAVGILLFSIHLVINAHFQVPVLDEGLYLYKGLLFVSGRYQPFQDYGPLTNQMPFAFLIPGVRAVSLRTGFESRTVFCSSIEFIHDPGIMVNQPPLDQSLAGSWSRMGHCHHPCCGKNIQHGDLRRINRLPACVGFISYTGR